MGCNSSTHTTAQDTAHDTAHEQSKSECNGASTTGTDREEREDNVDIVSSEASVANPESSILHTATDPTPAEDQEAGAPAADQPERTGPETPPGPNEEL